MIGANILSNGGLAETLTVTGRYDVKCLDADGNLKWEEHIDNLVVNVGKANILSVYLGAGTQTTTWYMGLVDTGSAYNAADTMSSHAGWSENTAYASATRPSVTFGTATASGGGALSAGTGSIVSTAVTFAMNASATILGAFLTTSSTKSGTTGTLYSVGSFSASRTVISGDSLLVTYTAQS